MFLEIIGFFEANFKRGLKRCYKHCFKHFLSVFCHVSLLLMLASCVPRDVAVIRDEAVISHPPTDRMINVAAASALWRSAERMADISACALGCGADGVV